MLPKAISIPRKTDRTYTVTIKKDGQAYDCTGWQLVFTVKDKLSRTDEQSKIIKTINFNDAPNNAAGGVAYLNLTNDNTDLQPATYKYGIKLVDGSGKVRKTGVGTFEIAQAANL